MIHQYLSEELLNALGWTVVHSLWQGVLIALILGIALMVLQQKSARIKYWLSNMALLAMLICSIVTFSMLLHQQNIETSINAMIMVDGEGMHHLSASSILQQFTDYFNANVPLIVTVWLMGLAFFILRMIAGLGYIFHLKNRHNQPLSDYWQEKLAQLATQINLHRPIELLESALVKVPMVVGFLKPVILMPLGAINNLSAQQVEAILAHELAHIARNDYFLNILQSFIEAIFYYHPAVWWISGNIRLERENCCDDIAITLCGNSLNYAKALVSLQEVHQAAPAFAMPFSNNKNQLITRIRRILNQPQTKSNIMEKFTATTMLVVALLMLSFGMPAPIDYLDKQEEVHLQMEKIERINLHRTEEEGTVIAMITYKDTIPDDLNTGQRTYIKRENGEHVEIKISKGKIKKLVIDGKLVDEADYDKYEKKIKEMKTELSNMPAPPAPPNPPSPVAVPEPPAPPTAPEAPDFSFQKKSRKITSKKDSKGNTIIIVEDEDKAPVEIEIENQQDGGQTLIIDGKVIDDFDNDDLVILEDKKGESSLFGNSSTWEAISLPPVTIDLEKAGLALTDLDEQLSTDLNSLGLLGSSHLFPDILNPSPLLNYPDNLLFMDGANEEMQQFFKAYENEYAERLKDGNLSQAWLNKKQMEMKELFPNKSFSLDNIYFSDALNLEDLGNDGYEYFFRNVESPRFKKFFNNTAFEKMKEEIYKDGLAKKGRLKNFELSQKHFKVNGKKQAKQYHQKYLNILEGEQGVHLEGNSKIKYQ